MHSPSLLPPHTHPPLTTPLTHSHPSSTTSTRHILILLLSPPLTHSHPPSYHLHYVISSRTPGTGLYDNLRQYNIPSPESIFDISYFATNPKPFFALARDLYPGKYAPNLVHYFVRLLQEKSVLLRNYTQNIDGLERCKQHCLYHMTLCVCDGFYFVCECVPHPAIYMYMCVCTCSCRHVCYAMFIEYVYIAKVTCYASHS